MDQLKRDILSLIYNKQGFVEISYELDNEIPQMIAQLQRYYNDDRSFYDILLQIRYRWGPIFSEPLKTKLSDFTTMYLNELEKIENMIKFAENHPDVVRIKEQEMTNLTDELAILMDPFSKVIKGIKKTSITPKLSIIKKKRN